MRDYRPLTSWVFDETTVVLTGQAAAEVRAVLQDKRIAAAFVARSEVARVAAVHIVTAGGNYNDRNRGTLNESQLLRPAAVAELKGVGVRAVRQAAEKGRLPVALVQNGCRLFRVADVNTWHPRIRRPSA